MWHCRCSCGTERDVAAGNLKNDGSKSCGCLSRKLTSSRQSKDLTGQKFGRLTAIRRIPPTKTRHTYYLCRCKCGKEKMVSAANLTSGQIISCGCYNREKTSRQFRKDLTGQKYGRLTVIEQAGHKNNKIVWRCKCDCGNEVIVSGNALRRGNTMSCGCYRSDLIRKNQSIDLTGKRFGQLTVLSTTDDIIAGNGRHYIAWLCRCDCGNEIVVRGENLRSGKAIHCGCQRNSVSSVVGSTNLMNCGLKATIIEAKNLKDMTIQFEDGAIKNHVSYSWFKKGGVRHQDWSNINPKNNEWHGYTNIHLAYRMHDAVYYYCVNRDGGEDILSPPEMLASKSMPD